MDVLVAILVGVVLGVAVAQVYRVIVSTGFTPEGWEKVREIVFEAIERGLQIYRSSKLGFDELVRTVADMIEEGIAAGDIPAADRRFWTTRNIELFVRPVLRELLERINREEFGESAPVDESPGNSKLTLLSPE